jgi:pSer/pThr/pTyr-binding forkhead associated (FHA) protein
VVVDLGSTNGTKVNGSGVRERRLEDGDEITVGTTTLRFEAS